MAIAGIAISQGKKCARRLRRTSTFDWSTTRTDSRSFTIQAFGDTSSGLQRRLIAAATGAAGPRRVRNAYVLPSSLTVGSSQ